MIISHELDGLRRQVEDCIASAYTKGYTKGYKKGLSDAQPQRHNDTIWDALSKVYNMKGLPDEAYSIIGDVMLGLQVEDGEADEAD